MSNVSQGQRCASCRCAVCGNTVPAVEPWTPTNITKMLAQIAILLGIIGGLLQQWSNHESVAKKIDTGIEKVDETKAVAETAEKRVIAVASKVDETATKVDEAKKTAKEAVDVTKKGQQEILKAVKDQQENLP